MVRLRDLAAAYVRGFGGERVQCQSIQELQRFGAFGKYGTLCHRDSRQLVDSYISSYCK
jgi:hypothetical protein